MSSVWSSAEAEGSELLLLLALADRAGDDGVTWSPVVELSKKTRLGQRQVLRLLAKLIEDGVLQQRKVQQGRIRRSVYRLNVPGLRPVEYDRLPFVVSPPFSERLARPYDMTPPSHVTDVMFHSDDMTSEVSDDMTPRARKAEKTVSITVKNLADTGVSDSVHVLYTKAQRDALWDALEAATKIKPEAIGERSLFGKCVKELLELDATPEEVKRRAAQWPKRYSGATLTPRALLMHWGELAGPRRAAANVGKCDICGDAPNVGQTIAEHKYDRHDIGKLCPDCAVVISPGEKHKCSATA
jgi:DNA-binding Lrp family transcriptional regulator